MSLPIERWARQAVMLEAKGCHEPVASKRVWDDINDAAALQFQEWKGRQRMLREGGFPLASEGVYAALGAYPPSAVQANVASLNGEAALWSTALWTPLPANGNLAPDAYRLAVSWTTTTSTSPGNLTINPRLGSFAAGASSSGGVAMGADAAITLTASITTQWYCRGDITIRTIGAPGANSTAIGFFNVVAKPATAGTGAATINDVFGHTAASYDASIASGVVLGMANTVTTITFAVQQVHWTSWN